jgi:hypothetical protein
VLFFKLASAQEKSGHCAIALIYYRRYLKEASPNETFIKLTNERIAICEKATGQSGADKGKPAAGDKGKPAVGDKGDKGDKGKPPTGPATTGTATTPTPPTDPTKTGGGTAVGDDSTAALSNPSTPSPKGGAKDGKPDETRGNRSAAWIAVGTSLGFITVGAVMAYSAKSSQDSITNLYGPAGQLPPVYDPATQKRYDDLTSQGDRYQLLSYISFGVAGAAAIAAVVLWSRTGDEHPASTSVGALQVTPVVTPSGAGISAALRF